MNKNVVSFPGVGPTLADDALRENEFGYMRAVNQRMEKALEEIMAYQPKFGEKGSLTAYHLQRIAMMGLGR